MWSRSIHALSFLALASTLTGCFDFGADDPIIDEWEPRPPPTTNSAPRPTPHIRDVTLPTWPPLGPQGTIDVSVDTVSGSGVLQASFRNTTSVPAYYGTVSVRAAELGEGFGSLGLTLSDASGGRATRVVEDLLIDLSPPQVELERAVVSPYASGLDGQIALWVADRYVLGSVEMTYRGKTFSHDFPHVYPESLGEAWDISRVAFPADDLPNGSGKALVVVRDAAGNATSTELVLRIDAVAPTLGFTSPADGTSASGPFDVVLLASDDATPGGDVAIDIELGGALATTLYGPTARLTIDPATLPKGPLVVRATARDEAGNRSEPVTRTVTIL